MIQLSSFEYLAHCWREKGRKRGKEKERKRERERGKQKREKGRNRRMPQQQMNDYNQLPSVVSRIAKFGGA